MGSPLVSDGQLCFSTFVAMGKICEGLILARFLMIVLWGEVCGLSGNENRCSEMNGLDGDRFVNTLAER
jgi:hypothetical protein